MTYRVSLKATADKSLGKLPIALQRRIVEKIIALGENPRPAGCTKLAGSSGMWRLRVGDYRVAYLIDDAQQTVSIRIVAHRREVYRDL
jgi:mRNA interferase RelE/StbE